MKIETTIQPRKDGVVNVKASDGTVLKFARDEFGRLVCDVEDTKHVAWLLSLSNYLPADEEDIAEAENLSLNTDGDEDEDEGEPDEDPDMNAAPIEEPASAVAAEAPAKVATPRKAKKAA